MITGVNPCCWIVDIGLLSALAKLNWSLTIVHFRKISANNKQKLYFFSSVY